jgi:hypothetical protein
VVQLSDFSIIDSYKMPDDRTIIARASDWQDRMAKDLGALQQSMQRQHMPVLFVMHPLSNEMGLDEQAMPGLMELGHRLPPDGTLERVVTQPFHSARVDWLNAWPLFDADAQSASHRPVFLSLDGHFTAYGNALLGKAIAARLSHERPWSHK